MRVLVEVFDPKVRSEATLEFPLQPGWFWSLRVSVDPPPTQTFVYPCMGCTGRAAFPIVGDTAVADSLVITWAGSRRSISNPVFE